MSELHGKFSGLTVNGKRLSIALNALRIIANLKGNGAMAKVARIALSDCRQVKKIHKTSTWSYHDDNGGATISHYKD